MVVNMNKWGYKYDGKICLDEACLLLKCNANTQRSNIFNAFQVQVGVKMNANTVISVPKFYKQESEKQRLQKMKMFLGKVFGKVDSVNWPEANQQRWMLSANESSVDSAYFSQHKSCDSESGVTEISAGGLVQQRRSLVNVKGIKQVAGGFEVRASSLEVQTKPTDTVPVRNMVTQTMDYGSLPHQGCQNKNSVPHTLMEMIVNQQRNSLLLELFSNKYELYDVTDSVRYWVWSDYVKYRLELLKVDEKTALLHIRTCLTGEALRLYERANDFVRGRVIETWRFLDNSFGEQRCNGVRESEFHFCNQQPKQSVRQYVSELESVCFLNREMEGFETVMIDKMSRGLREESHRKLAIKSLVSESESRLSDLVETIELEENHVKIEFELVKQEQNDRATQKQTQNRKKTTKLSGNSQICMEDRGYSEFTKCHRCGQLGHIRRNCTTLKVKESDKNVVCLNVETCNGVQHHKQKEFESPYIRVNGVIVDYGNYLMDNVTGNNFISSKFAQQLGVKPYNCLEHGCDFECNGVCHVMVSIYGGKCIVKCHVVDNLCHDIIIGNLSMGRLGIGLIGPNGVRYKCTTKSENKNGGSKPGKLADNFRKPNDPKFLYSSVIYTNNCKTEGEEDLKMVSRRNRHNSVDMLGTKLLLHGRSTHTDMYLHCEAVIWINVMMSEANDIQRRFICIR